MVLSIVFASCLPSVMDASNIQKTSEVEKVVDNVVEKEMNNLHVPGVAVVVTKGDEVLLSKGYGYADLEKKRKLDAKTTIMRAGSLAKTFTATAIMQLVEQNRVDLYQDINKYLKDYKATSYENHLITFHHLLTHTAGLDEYYYARDALSSKNLLDTSQLLKHYFQTQSPIRKPGEQFQYSNAGFGLAGNIVEQVTKQSFQSYMKTHIFDPLNMNGATFEFPEKNPNLASGYAYTGDRYQRIKDSLISLSGGGGLNLVPQDMAPFMMMQLNQGKYKGKSILQPSSIKQMQEQQFTMYPKVDGVGYGLFHGKLTNGEPLIIGKGVINGYVSKMFLIPSHKVGVFVIANSVQSGDELHWKVVNTFANKFLPNPKKEILIPTSSGINTKEIEGRYELTLTPEHGWGKWLKFLGAAIFQVQAQSNNKLRVTGTFPHEGEKTQTKEFLQTNKGLFEEIGGIHQLSFKQKAGYWELSGSVDFTFLKKSFWERSSTLMAIYIGSGLFFVITFLVCIVYWIICFVRKKKFSVNLLTMGVIAGLNTIFAVTQFFYGNSHVVYGYPFWYIWGISLLPIISMIVALYLLITISFSLAKSANKVSIIQIIFVIIAVMYTVYLYYWNLLPIHFS
jgi:CubicO group peptidase (beta-lactamase class C family)